MRPIEVMKFLRQFTVLVQRNLRLIWNDKMLLGSLILQAPFMVAVIKMVVDPNCFTSNLVNVGSRTALFILSAMAAFMGTLNSYREICKERDILSREVFGGLDLSAYVLSKFTVLSVIGIVQCVILYGGTLTFVDFAYPDPATGYLCSVAAMILTNISVMAVGLFISALLKKSESAILPVLFIIIMQVVFCDSLFALGDGASWVRYLTPAAWGIAVFSNACGINNWAPEIFEKEMFGYHPLVGLGVLAAIAVLFVLLTIVRLKRVYRQKD